MNYAIHAMQIGALVLSSALPISAIADNSLGEVLTGDTRLACEAILCLSSSLRPTECAPSLARYFGIQIFNKHGLDWPATVDARRAFLGLCPAGSEPGMPERLDAISKGAGKCDPQSLNATYRSVAYRWRIIGYQNSGEGDRAPIYEVHEIQTVTPEKLPGYCVTYNDHEWTYDLTVKYVGTALHGGYWVNAANYSAALGEWQANHGSTFTDGWTFSWTDPRENTTTRHNDGR